MCTQKIHANTLILNNIIHDKTPEILIYIKKRRTEYFAYKFCSMGIPPCYCESISKMQNKTLKQITFIFDVNFTL